MTADEAFEKWWNSLTKHSDNPELLDALKRIASAAWRASREQTTEESLKILDRMKYNPDRSVLGAIEEIRSTLLVVPRK